MKKYFKGQKVECVISCSGLDKEGIKNPHHNPPRKGEIFTVIDVVECGGKLYLELGEVTNIADDVWPSEKFKPLKEREVCENVKTKVEHYA